MISIEEAKKIIGDNLPSREVERVNLRDGLGRVLAEDIVAPESSPRYTNSAMDGFAVRWDDVQSANDKKAVSLSIIGESSAGVPFKKHIERGQAIRISTGAMIPEDADTVIPQEDTKLDTKTVSILKVTKRHQNLRFKGEEFSEGDTVLRKGATIQSPQIALLSALGILNVSVFRKPNVAIIVTGTEIRPFNSRIQPWQIRDSNSVMLKAAVAEAGGEIILSKIVSDDPMKMRLVLNSAVQQADIIIFSGGVSVGPHDLVKTAAEDSDFQTLFWKVNQKPGKPLFAAKKDNILLFGLPGNPVSAYMCYLLYIHPLIRYFLNLEENQKMIRGRLKESIESKLSRDHLLRVKIEDASDGIPSIIPIKKQGSHMLTSLTEADGFVLVKAKETLPTESVIAVNLF